MIPHSAPLGTYSQGGSPVSKPSYHGNSSNVGGSSNEWDSSDDSSSDDSVDEGMGHNRPQAAAAAAAAAGGTGDSREVEKVSSRVVHEVECTFWSGQ